MKARFSVIFFILGICLYGQHSLEKMPFPINTNYDEICPVFSYDEKLLFFTRVGSPDFNKTLIENHVDLSKVLASKNYFKKLENIYSEISGNDVDNVRNSDFNQDVWMMEISNGQVHHPGAPLNNALPNSICSNFFQENEYVIINQFPVQGGLKNGFSITKMKADGTFTIPIPIEIKGFNQSGVGVNLSMSQDGQHVFITVQKNDHPDSRDIYLSVKAIGNIYSPPKSLGTTINSKYREGTPFITQDKRRLYFASNRPGGYGGMDIYYSERLDYTYRNWSEPKLLGPPINSAADDSFPYVCIDENTIYFSSGRDGNSDIFKAKIYRDDLLDKPVAVNINIRNEAMELIQGSIYWGEAYTDAMPGFFRTNTGQYRYIIEDNIPMVFTASRRSLKSEIIMVDPQELKDKRTHEVTLNFILKNPRNNISEDHYGRASETEHSSSPDIEDLPTIQKDKTIILRNIYFARSQPIVLKKSFPKLKKLAAVLLRNPEVTIQIEGHTDNVGNKIDLMELSWKRAEAIKDFLVEEGVSENNISTRGFGDTRPISSNANENTRKKNRRVEIRVIRQ